MTHTASLSHCFVSAFAGWFATADLDDILTIKPTPDRDAVDINFCVSEGALQGYAQSSGISVAAMLGEECWDLLWDEDIVATCAKAGWFCSLCPVEERRYFPSIEALWLDHLFEPLGRWIANTLRFAQAVVFLREMGRLGRACLSIQYRMRKVARSS